METLQREIKRKMESSPLEGKLPHDERMQTQLDPKNVTIYFNDILGKGTSATVYKGMCWTSGLQPERLIRSFGFVYSDESGTLLWD